MSYLIQSRLRQDRALIDRVTACAAMEEVADPYQWVVAHDWQLSAQPGWVEAYASALTVVGKPPGENEAAITDGMILSAVQALNNPAN